jgi:peptide/nickel transport system substrate-binding protein
MQAARRRLSRDLRDLSEAHGAAPAPTARPSRLYPRHRGSGQPRPGPPARQPPAGRFRPVIHSLLLVALAFTPSCKQEPATPTADGPPASLVVASGADFSGPNELLGGHRVDHEIRSQLYLHLLRENPDYQDHPPTFAPELARSWELSADRLALTFELRDDALWSDGTPITATDVRFTWQAQTSPDVGWGFSYLKEAIRDVEVVTPHRVRFHFTRAYPGQLIDANEGFVLPAHAWEELPFAQWRESADWFAASPVVSGPFTIERWRPQEELVLARNPRFAALDEPAAGDELAAGRPVARVVFRVVPDEAARVQELLAGAADLVEGIPPERVDEVEASPRARVEALWARQYTFIAWNTRRPPFDDPLVRRALTQAIDREALVEALWNGRARVAIGPIPSTVWAHLDELAPWPHDPAAARALLASRGFRDADGDGTLERAGRPLSFELSTTAGNQLRHDAVLLIQEQLRQVGIDARPAFRDPAAQAARTRAGEFDGALSAWLIDTGLDLRYAFHSGESDDGNWGAYADPEVDRLLEEIARLPDPEGALPLHHEVQRLLHRDQPYTFLWEPQFLVGLSERLEGATPNALRTLHDLHRWRLR